jgi:hypothetical protein
LFADAAELVLAPARILLRHEPDPGREVPSRSERLGLGTELARQSFCALMYEVAMVRR